MDDHPHYPSDKEEDENVASSPTQCDGPNPDLIRSDEESAVETDYGSNPRSQDEVLSNPGYDDETPSISSEENKSNEESDDDFPQIRKNQELSEDDQAETLEILFDLRETLTTSKKDFVFACGGSIPTTTPVTLRWDPQNDSKLASQCKLSFPDTTNQEDNIAALVNDMLPASFGHGGETVYDETYRKALQLDPSKFSTNFCPYTTGIIKEVTHALAQSFRAEASSVRAELYKLNIYQGPSGHFRSHVDTPRSPTHFGSLVVCLPLPHSGGALELEHNDKTIIFDWSNSGEQKADEQDEQDEQAEQEKGEEADEQDEQDEAEEQGENEEEDGQEVPSIQWAAFYSDCTHQVHPVTSGHRLTLTYNLYAVPHDPLSKPLTLDLPLLRQMKSILSNPHFLPKGGYLGLFTTHAYPHTSASFSIKTYLKGLDKVFWHGFQSLGCGVCLRPVVDNHEPDYFGNPRRSKPNLGNYFKICQIDQFHREYDLGFKEVHWLNEGGKEREAQYCYPSTYGNEAAASLEYSWCAIIVGIPGYDEELGGRMRLEKTFEEREKNWDDRDCEVRLLSEVWE
ncbi:putative 2og-fe oxygenase family protein [Podospora fimiseda]|uniref:2og-fe oxygenase family protein n=1 Tax=Podospora fimiseda TaxID=252190 RepID=A0AAN7BKB0_9PEZI|nr:putative 2og-fe oxygenase family protein [Podospora fimiseda]